MSAILSLLGFIKDLWGVINQAVAFYNQAKREGWFQDGQAITRSVQNAQSDDERRALVRRLADNIRSTP